jgi:hypothetical protein
MSCAENAVAFSTAMLDMSSSHSSAPASPVAVRIDARSATGSTGVVRRVMNVMRAIVRPTLCYDVKYIARP